VDKTVEKGIGQALVAPDVVSGKTALRAELGKGGEISNPDASPRLLMRYFLEVETSRSAATSRTPHPGSDW
jgi:hypothetical protein